MTARQYLSQAKEIKIGLATLAEQLEFLRAAAEHLAPRYRDRPRPAGGNIHKTEDAIIRVLDFEERMKAQYGKLAEINGTINAVAGPLLRSILVKRYVADKKWTKIAGETSICERHLRRLHKRALAEVDILLKRGR